MTAIGPLLHRVPNRQDPTETEVISDVGEAITRNTIDEWLIAVAIVVVGGMLAITVRRLLGRLVNRNSSGSFLGDLLGRLAGYLVATVALVYALEQLGVQVTPILGALGLAGIAIAFALQSILENFVAGVLLQLRRPFSKGDEIISQDTTGRIVAIDSRTMTVRTPDGVLVRLPNAEVISHAITNLTTEGRRRTTVVVGVAYGTDLPRACRIAREAITGCEGVLTLPDAAVYAAEFGASSIDLNCFFWHGPTIAERHRVRHRVILAIAAAFEQHDITIPFPQRTLHLAPDAIDALPTVGRGPRDADADAQ